MLLLAWILGVDGRWIPTVDTHAAGFAHAGFAPEALGMGGFQAGCCNIVSAEYAAGSSTPHTSRNRQPPSSADIVRVPEQARAAPFRRVVRSATVHHHGRGRRPGLPTATTRKVAITTRDRPL